MTELNKLFPNFGTHALKDLIYATGLDKEGKVQFTSSKAKKIIFVVLNALGLRTSRDVSKNLLNANQMRVGKLSAEGLKNELKTFEGIAGLNALVKVEEMMATSLKMADVANNKGLTQAVNNFLKPLIEERKSELLMDLYNDVSKTNKREFSLEKESEINEVLVKLIPSSSSESKRIIDKIQNQLPVTGELRQFI